jgi:flagellar biogenesis protein FliO
VIVLLDTAREALELALVAIALSVVSALVGLASWALYRIEREEMGRDSGRGRRPFEW